MLKDDERMIDFKVFWGFALRLTDRWTDICDCRVAFATEKNLKKNFMIHPMIHSAHNSYSNKFITFLLPINSGIVKADLDILF